ncbi:hypothetical protein D8895_04635 [Streptococcus sp. BCA20]|jgi:prophage lp1 protein 6|uniref:Prophage Lp1 protein 6 n=4 Tax=Streptococcus TaxID=1301 RepID=A0A0F2D9Q2_STROR|nr:MULTISPECIES: hypothetical protein [Streptococcus]EKA14821.1 hypothetical protein GMD2S_06692 [Streptococcus sp. GMD2S]RSJ37655.1 hypothetical protein D8895_04635 [Streptococcus sp. BCA20]ANR74510.1 hypothetical protein AXF18_00470 [Streptococcus sp. oral taxon 064]EFE56150.1 hypothetical protein HMPREF8579_1712 [Streptococcus oralis ATCC 35037]EFO03143.1 hypothetical protein SMSK23_0129 [Streptococcus oralis ATCC 35037]
MKTKALARVNAIFGLISGIVLLLAPLVMFMIAVGAAAATEDSDATVGILTIFSIILALVKIAVLVLGIVSIVYYKDDERVTPAPSVLFIVGGSVGLIPFLGWVGGILTIIGGSLYFGLLKKFEIQE